MSKIGIVVTLTLLVSYPVMGALSDCIGRRPVMIAACAGFILLGWPLFGLVDGRSVPTTMVATSLLAFATAAFISCLGLSARNM